MSMLTADNVQRDDSDVTLCRFWLWTRVFLGRSLNQLMQCAKDMGKAPTIKISMLRMVDLGNSIYLNPIDRSLTTPLGFMTPPSPDRPPLKEA